MGMSLRLALTLSTALSSVGSGPTWSADFTKSVLPAGVSVSSPSLGGLVGDASGKLTYKPNNLWPYSHSFSGTWSTQTTATITDNVVTAPDGTLTGAALNLSTANIGTGAYTSTNYNPVVGGRNNIKSIYVRADAAGGTIELADAETTGGVTTATLTTSWQRIWLAEGAQPNRASIWLRRTASSPATVYIAQAMIEAVTYQTTPGPYVATQASAYYGPAWDYDTAGNALGLRIWESRTNVVKSSNNIADSGNWVVQGFTTAQNAASPEGLNNGWTLSESSSTTNFNFYQPGPGGAAAQRVTSVFLKAGGRRYVTLCVGSYAATRIDLQTGAIVDTNDNQGTAGIVTTVKPVGNGWYRLALAANTINDFIVISPSDNTQTLATIKASETYYRQTVSGLNAPSFYFYGLQLEAASFAGPYIPTGASAVTAAADVVTLGGVPLGVLQGSAGSLIVEASSVLGTYGNLVGLGTINGALLYRNNNSTTQIGTDTHAGALFATIGSSGATTGTFRAGVGFSASGVSLVAGGGSVVSNSSTTYTDNNTTLGGRTQGFYANGYIRQLALYNSRLPDATLQAKSVVGAAF